MRKLLLFVVSASTIGCAHDFVLNTIEEGDAVAEAWEDTGAPVEEEVELEKEEEEEPAPQEEPVEEDPPAEDDCEDTSDLVYVIDKESEELFLFHPDTLSLESLGVLDCDYWSTPASMGVARDGVAYVRYADDHVYAVDLETMNCTPTTYGDQPNTFGSFGMGYATQSAKTWRDDLFVANSKQLARLDDTTWTLEQLGRLPSQAELTGNADGELWGFLPLESPAELVQLDKEDGSVLETIKMPSFPDPYDIDTFAFATWDGDFYLFVRTFGMGSSTDVYRVSENGQMTRVLENIGINVVGAGVSTCAPS